MRTAIADFEVLDALPERVLPGSFRCRAPQRLGLGPAPVAVAVVSAGHTLSEVIPRLARLGPDHLPRLLESGPAGEKEKYLALECFSGTLETPQRAMDPAERLAAVTAAARGAHRLHQAGHAHGWIRPSAVWLTERGPVLGLAPLGLPRGQIASLGAGADAAFVDPDVLAGDPPSRASDIWSLGATLHQALSAEALFGGIEKDQVVTAVQRVMFTRPRPEAGLPDRVAAVATRCLARDPADRYRTAAELADDLEAAGGDL